MQRGWGGPWGLVVLLGFVACGGPLPDALEEGAPAEAPEAPVPAPPPAEAPAPAPPPVAQPEEPDEGSPPPAEPPAEDGDTRADGGTPPLPPRPPPAAPPAPPRPFQFPPLQTELPHYELTLPPETLALFARDVFAPEQPATFTFEGRTRKVRVRLRGTSARFWPKKSWRIEFPKGTKFQGRRKLNLIAEYQDATLMVEKLGYDILAALGAPAPRARYVRLSINGVYQGVFLDLERVDKNFLDAHDFADDDATIYRCGGKDCEMKPWRTPYQRPWQKKNNEEDPDDSDLRALLEAINYTPEPDLPRVLAERLELEDYLRVMAMEALIANNVVQDSGSYLLFDRVTGRATYVPWDINNSDARWWPSYGLGMEPLVEHPLFLFSLTDTHLVKLYEKRQHEAPDFLPAFSQLNTRIAFHPQLRERLSRLIERALDELYDPDVILPRLEAQHALLAPYVEEDPYLTVEDARNRPPGVTGLRQFRQGLPYLQAFVTRRAAFLRQELRRHRERPLGLALCAFSPREGWVELCNHGEEPVSTRGLVLTKNLRRALERNVPARTVPPGGRVRFTAEQLGLTVTPPPRTGGAPGFPPQGELGLFTGDSVVGVLDVLFYGELPPGRRYARHPEEPTRWEVR